MTDRFKPGDRVVRYVGDWESRPAGRALTKQEIEADWDWLCEQFGEDMVSEALKNAPEEPA